ncbi:MAG: PLP-dependent aspartate aminotransferase family protein [Eubacteriales bacterium]
MTDNMILEHFGEEYERYYNAIVPPIYMTSLHIYDSIDAYYDSDKTDIHHYCYGRLQNPTVRIAERKIAELEKGINAYLFSSGMSAATAAVLTACKAEGHIVCINNAYGPLKEFIRNYCKDHMNITATFIDGDTTEEFEEAITEKTELVILESPSSVVFSVQDIEKVSELAHAKGALVYIDNSMCTPLYQKPLTLGADFVMHTVSKYLGGHSDLIGGALIVRDKELDVKVAKTRELIGSIIGPMEGWLVLRGLRTLAIRVKEHGRVALEIAKYLENHSKVERVIYTGLDSYPQREILEKQQSGHVGLVSFVLKADLETSKKFCETLEVFKIGVSWGGFESLVMMPHARQEESACTVLRGEQRIIRIHCGLEGEEVLLSDLEQALSQI